MLTPYVIPFYCMPVIAQMDAYSKSFITPSISPLLYYTLNIPLCRRVTYRIIAVNNVAQYINKAVRLPLIHIGVQFALQSPLETLNR